MGSANRVAAINPPTPPSTIRTRYRNSASTPGATRTGKNKQDSLQRSPYGISVSTPHRRYGHRLRTPFLRTPFPRLLFLGTSGSLVKSIEREVPGKLLGDFWEVRGESGKSRQIPEALGESDSLRANIASNPGVHPEVGRFRRAVAKSRSTRKRWYIS